MTSLNIKAAINVREGHSVDCWKYLSITIIDEMPLFVTLITILIVDLIHMKETKCEVVILHLYLV